MPLRMPRRAGMPLATGQVTRYSSENDDGFYEVGLTKRYTVLTTGQYSGACVFVLDGKTETQSHNCVLDLNTGLMWARYTSAENAAMGAASDGKMPWTGELYDIFQYCAAANVASLGGYSDWRIPNDEELASLKSMEAPTAKPDSTAFPGWSGDIFWTSTTRANDATNALKCYFDRGEVSVSVKTNSFFGALVRGGV